ncbi:MAG: ABC transporter ATP-binding protein [Candidatus Schekmanbacteria bacterium]|nr:ABC transporter ATP-binding protein [Candidatus Schekmanbacteria bacterium]
MSQATDSACEPEVAIRVEDLRKTYNLYRRPVDLLLEKLLPGGRQRHDCVEALRGVSFEVARGECLGIIGPNGGGKSTLLRILSGIQQPTSGRVEVRGAMSALLALGSGFVPDMSGRENAALYGSLRGIASADSDRYVALVEDFAELEEFFDRPVRIYSSGMFMRLAFACAVELIPDIVIIDEALSVGDAYFQHKCVSRLQDLRRNRRTILLVSHDPNLIKSMCNRAMLLYAGQRLEYGDPGAVIDDYHRIRFEQDRRAVAGRRELRRAVTTNATEATGDSPAAPGLAERRPLAAPCTAEALGPELWARRHAFNAAVANNKRYGTREGEIIDIRLRDHDNVPSNSVVYGREVTVVVTTYYANPITAPILGFMLRDHRGYDVIGVNTHTCGAELPCPGAGAVVDVAFRLTLRLRPGSYSLAPGLSYSLNDLDYMDWINQALTFEVVAADAFPVYGVTYFDTEVTFARLR